MLIINQHSQQYMGKYRCSLCTNFYSHYCITCISICDKWWAVLY